MIPKAHFSNREGKVLLVLFWVMSFACIAGLVITWVASERARPVMLDLETGQPVKQKPPL